MAHKNFTDLVNNGAWAVLSRLMVLFGFPLITGLLAYGAAVTLEKIDLKIEYVIHQMEELKETTGDTMGRVNILENSVGRAEEKLNSIDARLTQLEAKRK